MKRTIQRARQHKIIPLANSTSLGDLEIPEKFTQTINGQPFLLYDSGPSNYRILFIFNTQKLGFDGSKHSLVR